MEENQDIPICPRSGETNLYYLIKQHVKIGRTPSKEKKELYIN